MVQRKQGHSLSPFFERLQKRRVSKKLSNSAEISKEIPYNEIKIEILIENVKTSVILDTGSQTNLISRKTLNQITKNWQPLPEQTERCGVGVGGKPFKFVFNHIKCNVK